jgi:hypothetical protein
MSTISWSAEFAKVMKRSANCASSVLALHGGQGHLRLEGG